MLSETHVYSTTLEKHFLVGSSRLLVWHCPTRWVLYHVQNMSGWWLPWQPSSWASFKSHWRCNDKRKTFDNRLIEVTALRQQPRITNDKLSNVSSHAFGRMGWFIRLEERRDLLSTVVVTRPNHNNIVIPLVIHASSRVVLQQVMSSQVSDLPVHVALQNVFAILSSNINWGCRHASCSLSNASWHASGGMAHDVFMYIMVF